MLFRSILNFYNGYYFTFVHIGGRSKYSHIIRVSIASAVAECWLGKKPDGYEVDHIDRNTHNNDYRNLRYVTHSEQMKNRDYTNIAKQGTINLEKSRKLRMIPVKVVGCDEEHTFESLASCARFLSEKYNKPIATFSDRLRKRRKHIYDYDIIFLNAETKHGRSKEQEIVQPS